MRVSEYFQLGRTQAVLDFVDVDVLGDTRLFVDPQALVAAGTDWSDRAVSLVQNFFSEVIAAISAGKADRARALLSQLREPNETHLGMSRGIARGRGLGSDSAMDVYQALSASGAARSGLLSDLEDAALMIPGIDKDIISDMTTNIIRAPLIAYTQEVCEYYGIPMSEIDSGPVWDSVQKKWINGLTKLPIVSGSKLLLVPKSIVRQELHYRADEYYNNYILRYLQDHEMSAGSNLVEALKNGRFRVTKKSVKAKYGTGKAAAARITQQFPQILDQYRQVKAANPTTPLTHQNLADFAGFVEPDFDALLAEVLVVQPGAAGATAYHRAVEGLLSAICYPALTDPLRENRIHDGRKRIDIRYRNSAHSGFFYWLSTHYVAPYIFVECKNYSQELENPEYDQLAGRFSPQRGRVGLLLYRGYMDKDKAWQSCVDTAKDDRGWMIPLDDEDLKALVAERKQAGLGGEFALLRNAFDRLVS